MVNEVKAKSGKEVLKIAGRALKDPGSLDTDEIQSLAGSVVTQAADIVELKEELKAALKAQKVPKKLPRGN